VEQSYQTSQCEDESNTKEATLASKIKYGNTFKSSVEGKS
jgi:hypothetical protein